MPYAQNFVHGNNASYSTLCVWVCVSVCVCVRVCSYYQLEEASPTAVNEFLTALVNSAIGELQQSCCFNIEAVGIWLSTSYQKAIHFPCYVIGWEVLDTISTG